MFLSLNAVPSDFFLMLQGPAEMLTFLQGPPVPPFPG